METLNVYSFKEDSMFDFALQNIFKRPVRSILTMVSVALSICLIIIITGIVDYQIRTMHEHASAAAGKIHVQPFTAGNNYPALTIEMPENIARDILSASDLQDNLCTEILYFALENPRFPNEPPRVILTGVPAGKEEAFTGSISNDIKPLKGREFFDQNTAPNQCILGKAVAEYYAEKMEREINVGDSVTLLDREFVITGILEDSANQVVNNAVMIPLDKAQSNLSKEGYVSSVIITPQKVGVDKAIIQKLSQNDFKLAIITDEYIRRNLESGIKLFENMISMISIVVVLGAVLLIMTVTLITVKERTREIGIMRALGMSAFKIILTLFWEIMLISVIGVLTGSVLAGFILRYGLMENLFNIWHILRFIPLVICIAFAATIFPALRIIKIAPLKALHYE
jgi:putative ABC transport system permease protein